MRPNYTFFPSKEDNSYIKALLAIFVLVHHIYQETPIFAGTIWDTIFLSLGYLSVASFFFISGYGLAVSEKNKGEEYVKGIPAKRIAPLYIHILLLNVIYFLLNGFLNNKLDYSSLADAIFRNNSLIRNGWYLTVSLMTYIVFYFVYKLSKNTIVRLLSVTAVLMLFGMVCIRIWGYGTWWYESNLTFVIGLLWGSIYKDEEKQNKTKGYIFLLLGTGITFAITFYLINKAVFAPQMYLIVKSICASSFSLTLILGKIAIPIKSKILLYVSRLSFEIYVSQGLFLSLFHSNRIYINNPALYIITVICFTILFSVVLNSIFKQVDKKILA